MNLLENIEYSLNTFADAMWGTPTLLMLVGGGIFLTLYSRLRAYRHLGHAIALLRGRYNRSSDPGHLSHAQALSTALSGTLGLGNIAGVAIAISVGGPGAVFWMWMTALIGVTTKFYTATLAVMYRGHDSEGELRGGPMYVIREGLGRRWYPLAVLFAVAGMFGTLPVFQANQLIALLREGPPAGPRRRTAWFSMSAPVPCWRRWCCWWCWARSSGSGMSPSPWCRPWCCFTWG